MRSEDVDPGGGASLTTDPAAGSSAATDVSLREYQALDRLWVWRFMEERDRRYAEVQREREKALQIKERADRDALELARAIQTYKDEKANELREQISRERGEYVTQSELKGVVGEIRAILKPVEEYIAGQQGGRQGALDQRQLVAWIIAAAAGVWALVQAFS